MLFACGAQCIYREIKLIFRNKIYMYANIYVYIC